RNHIDGDLCTLDCSRSTRCDGDINVRCDDANECTVSGCNPDTGCTQQPVPNGTACAAGVGACLYGTCVQQAVVTRGDTTCGLSKEGAVRCWGGDFYTTFLAPSFGIFSKI